MTTTRRDHRADVASATYFASACERCGYRTVPTAFPDAATDPRCPACPDGGRWQEYPLTPDQAAAWERRRRGGKDGEL